MAVGSYMYCVAASRNGRWIAAGSTSGDVLVWDATTYNQVFAERTGITTYDVDFSTHLVSASSNGTATIRDVAARRNLRTLNHGNYLYSAKYSPQGDRIATGDPGSIRVWDSNDGQLLVSINVGVANLNCLFWCNNHLFVRPGDSIIKQIDAATGSTLSEWPVPAAAGWPCIAVPRHGDFIACTATKAITVWDTTTHSQLSHIQLTHNISSIACSSDDEFLAIGGGRIIVKELLSPVSVCSMSCLRFILVTSRFHHAF